LKKILVGFFVAIIALFILIQLVPYGRNHQNPPVVQEFPWASPEARQIAQKACYDCHSNETIWPWYSNLAPVSWMLKNHVIEGRQHLNFSEWGHGGHDDELDEVAEVLREGEMPPRQYLLMHPEAKLTPAEQDTLIKGIPSVAGFGRDEDHDD
jgi:hypothetical protein